jgi:hypothetical protein
VAVSKVMRNMASLEGLNRRNLSTESAMKFDINETLVAERELAKSRTIKTLFKVICQDNEFSLLRQTLMLYCEELERQVEE